MHMQCLRRRLWLRYRASGTDHPAVWENLYTEMLKKVCLRNEKAQELRKRYSPCVRDTIPELVSC